MPNPTWVLRATYRTNENPAAFQAGAERNVSRYRQGPPTISCVRAEIHYNCLRNCLELKIYHSGGWPTIIPRRSRDELLWKYVPNVDPYPTDATRRLVVFCGRMPLMLSLMSLSGGLTVTVCIPRPAITVHNGIRTMYLVSNNPFSPLIKSIARPPHVDASNVVIHKLTRVTYYYHQ